MQCPMLYSKGINDALHVERTAVDYIGQSTRLFSVVVHTHIPFLGTVTL